MAASSSHLNLVNLSDRSASATVWGTVLDDENRNLTINSNIKDMVNFI